MNSSSDHQKKPEVEEDGSVHQDTSGNNDSSPEKAKGRHTVPCIPPARYASFLNLNRVNRVKLQMGTYISSLCGVHGAWETPEAITMVR